VMVARERDQGGVAFHSTTLGSVVWAALGEVHGPPRRGRARRHHDYPRPR
jgi:hypothetical protein